MPSRSPSRERAYRDSSPNSPLIPLSPSALPQWIRQGRPRTALLSNGRSKVLLIALGCILMGWMFTSTLGPTDNDLTDLDSTYDVASGGVLTNPEGYGSSKGPVAESRPGILGDVDPEDDMDLDEAIAAAKNPSVKGALSELHEAVKDKLQAWNPYKSSCGDAALNATRTKSKGAHATTSLLAGESITEGQTEHERLGSRVRIGKCTILFDTGNSDSYWERAVRTHERHNKEHGYRLYVLRQQILDTVWSKPAYILKLLLDELSKPPSERLDWLLWFDADTVVLNPKIPLDVFLPPPGSEFDDINLVYSNDWNGLNNGVFPVRVSRWAAELFSGIVSYRHFVPDDPLLFRDQSAQDNLMHDPHWSPNVVEAPQRWFNAYQGEHNETLAPFQIRRGDLLVHFAGVPERDIRMSYWLDRAEQHLEDWEVELKSTSYPQEAKDFWNEQREKRKQKKEELAKVRTKAKDLIGSVEKKLQEFGERVAEESRTKIQEEVDELIHILDDGERNSEKELIESQMENLVSKSEPLNMALEQANKKLLKSAHEAIFAGEKDLLDGDATDPDMQDISEKVTKLKGLVMVPQEEWDRALIILATTELVEARAKVQEKIAAKQKAIEDKKKAALEVAELKKQVQKEAGMNVEKVAQPASPGLHAAEAQTQSHSADTGAGNLPASPDSHAADAQAQSNTAGTVVANQPDTVPPPPVQSVEVS